MGAVAPSGSAPQPADDRGDGGGEADPGSAGMRVARGAGRIGEPVPVGGRVRGAGRGAGAAAPGAGAGAGAGQGQPPLPGRGRPGLRLAAWRAVWAAMPNTPVMAARFAYLTTRQDNRLARQQARTACAAALLRWIHVVITRHVAWDPAIAAGNTPAQRAA